MSITTAVILAAGLGSRLGQLAGDSPKGFMEVGGETLIARSLRLLRARGITRTVLVTGYGHAAYDALLPCHAGLETVHNAQFASSGSMASLACALEHVSEPFLLLESDLYYEPRALDVLLAAPSADVILASGATGAGDEVYVEAALGRLVNLSKRRAELGSACAELVGISKLSPRSADAMRHVFTRFVAKHGHAQMAYETEALVEVARSLPVLVQVVPDLLWGELDDASHLARLCRDVEPQMAARETRVMPVAREILLNPGPATTRDEVKAALVMPDVCPREASFAALYADVRQRLATLAGPRDEVCALPIPGSGTSALEAMLGSVVGPSDRLLVIDNGDYGARLAQIAERLALHCEVLGCGWAAPLDLQVLRARLAQRETRPTFLALVQHETSSGLLNPIAAVAELAREHGTKVLVDAMSSFGALPISVGAGGVAALVSSANKCLEGMAGLAFVVLERSLLERSRAHRARSFVLDLVAEHDHLRATGQSRFTLPPQIVSALAVALRIHEREGRAGRQARYAHSMRTLRQGLDELGFSPLLAPEHESQILIAVREPSGDWFDFEQLHAAMRARGFTVYPGKNGPVRTFRLSVLGAIDERDIRRFLVELTRFTDTARSRQEAPRA